MTCELYQKYKETMNRSTKNYYNKHKEEIAAYKNQKKTCKCGGKYTLNGKSQHLKTKKHQKYLEEK